MFSPQSDESPTAHVYPQFCFSFSRVFCLSPSIADGRRLGEVGRCRLLRGLAAIGIGRRTVLRDLKGLLTVDVAHLCVGLGVRRELSVRRRGGLGVGAMARKKSNQGEFGTRNNSSCVRRLADATGARLGQSSKTHSNWLRCFSSLQPAHDFVMTMIDLDLYFVLCFMYLELLLRTEILSMSKIC